MVKSTVATTVAIVQLAMLAKTAVSIPIEYAQGLELRGTSNPNGQQLAKREGWAAATAAGLGAFFFTHALIKDHDQKKQDENRVQPASKSPQPASEGQQPPVRGQQLGDEGKPPNGGHEPPVNGQQPNRQEGDPPATAQPAQNSSSRRDLSDIYERDWDDYYEKRDFKDFEERDWNDFEERDWDDYELEARGLDFDEIDELD